MNALWDCLVIYHPDKDAFAYLSGEGTGSYSVSWVMDMKECIGSLLIIEDENVGGGGSAHSNRLRQLLSIYYNSGSDEYVIVKEEFNNSVWVPITALKTDLGVIDYDGILHVHYDASFPVVI